MPHHYLPPRRFSVILVASGVAAVILASGMSLPTHGQSADPIPFPRRTLPPAGEAISREDRASLEREAAALAASIDAFRARSPDAELLPDVEIFHKAVAWALELDEFYRPNDVRTAHLLLQQGQDRLNQLQAGDAPWTKATGLVVRGFRSALDDSVQPYGLEIPEGHDFGRPCPLGVWLHGRGDRDTELAFLEQRQRSAGPLTPEGAIVLHPFGRYCNGFKSAGEVDVLEAVAAVREQYRIDPDRIVLAGFSMGGAGAWHLGAHYAERWCAVHAGAGFAETARYQKLRPEQFPPWYEQTLWQVYDVPGYVRNLFNLPLVAYSGEVDPQMQAARVMEEAYAANGREFTHLIGPGMGHKYAPEPLEEIRRMLAEAVETGRDPYAAEVAWQSPTLRYSRMHWVEALGLDAHWKDSRIDARRDDDDRSIHLSTVNVSALRLTSPWRDENAFGEALVIEIDGQRLDVAADPDRNELLLVREAGDWHATAAFPSPEQLRKSPGLQGPIDDVLLEPFLVVAPSGRCANPLVDRWVQFELTHFKDRWRRLFRGEVREKLDRDLTAEDLRNYHLIVWGDPAANTLLAQAIDELPLEWSADELTIADESFDAAGAAPMMIYPNPLSPDRYLALNGALTFREGHDRTNSLQNPKLPDWAVIGLERLPDALAAGEVLAAGFFDEHWRTRSTASKTTPGSPP